MSDYQPVAVSHNGRREFACSPAALLVFILNPDERVLMLSHPNSGGRWEVINGALDGDESVLDGVLRETREEAGDQVRVRPLGAFHAYMYPYDARLRYMISICYLLAYDGGAVIPGDDMAGSAVDWFSLDEIESGAVVRVVPNELPWLFRRAVAVYRLLNDLPPVELEPHLDQPPGVKYPK